MGYEVLDTDGARLELPSTPVPPSEVVAFDELPPPSDDSEYLVDGRTVAHRRTSWNALRHRRIGFLLTAAAVAATLVVGATLGATWADRRAQQQRAAERAAALSVVITVTGVDPIPDTPAADFTVRIVNAGPLPVQLVTSPQYAALSTKVVVVRDLGGAHEVPAGGTLMASLRLAVDCTGKQDVAGALLVPVRTADGTVHQVRATDEGLLLSAMYGQSPCSSGRPALDAELVGTISRPLLRLTNTSGIPQEVELDLENSPFIAQHGSFSVLRLSPPLPQLLQPHEIVLAAVILHPGDCPHGLSVVLGSQVAPYIVLKTGMPGAQGLAQDRVGVDLGALWGAALARDCP